MSLSKIASKYYIYEIYDKQAPWMFYIGHTIDLKRRWFRHKHKHKDVNDTRMFYRYMRKYGFDRFEYSPIAYIIGSLKTARLLEQQFIDDLNPSLNDRASVKVIGYTIEKKEYNKSRQKQHRKDHLEELHKKTKCECGGRYTNESKHKHIKLKIHTDFVAGIITEKKGSLCEICGGRYTKINHKAHLNTKKHQNALKIEPEKIEIVEEVSVKS